MNPSSSSSSPSSATSPIPAFGQNYQPGHQENPFPNCYVPQPPNSDYQFQPYQQQQNAWSQQAPSQYPPQQYPGQVYPQQQYPNFQYPPQQHYQQQQPPFFQQQPHFIQQQPIPQFSTQPSYSQSTQPGPSAGKKKSRKGKAPMTSPSSPPKPRNKFWSEDEALALSKAWITVSEDPNISTNQSKDTFWYRVLMIHNQSWSGENRTKHALSGKWTEIQKKVRAFNGIYSQLAQSRPSGASDTDILGAAITEYHMTTGGQDFTDFASWNFLKDKEKFLNPDTCVVGRRNRKRNPDGGTSAELPFNLEDDEYDGGDDPFHADEDRNPRPGGRRSKSARTSSNSGSGRSSDPFTDRLENRLEEISLKKTTSSSRASQHFERLNKMAGKKMAFEILKMSSADMDPDDAAVLEAEKQQLREKFRSGYFNLD